MTRRLRDCRKELLSDSVRVADVAETSAAYDASYGCLDDLDVAEAVIGQGGYVDQATDYLQTLAAESFAWDMGELCLWAACGPTMTTTRQSPTPVRP